jgi:hypothetical protein
VRLKTILFSGLVLLVVMANARAQQQNNQTPVEKRVPLSETAVAFDASGAAALDATLRTTVINGAPDTPVTNIRMVVRNASPNAFSYLSGLVTFYDNASVRCGEGIFKADALASGEAFETDTPGIRVRCSPTTWRIVATNLVGKNPQATTPSVPESKPVNLLISIDGEEHPVQIDKPMTVTLGDKQRTILVRQAP